MAIKFSEEKGELIITKDVLSKIVGMAATNCYGVVGMSGQTFFDGIDSMLKRENLSKGVDITVGEDNSISVKLYIIVKYGTNVRTIGNSVTNAVRYKLEESTGVKDINIKVVIDGMNV